MVVDSPGYIGAFSRSLGRLILHCLDVVKTAQIPLPKSLDVRASIPLFAEVEGAPSYLRSLDAAAKELLRELLADEDVKNATEKQVEVDEYCVGTLKSVSIGKSSTKIEALKYILHSLAYVGSRPMGSKGQRLHYVAVPMSNAAFSTGSEYAHLKRDAFRQMVLANLARTAWIDYRPSYQDKKTGERYRTRIAAKRPFLDWMIQRGLIFPFHPYGHKTKPKMDHVLRIKKGEDERIPAFPLERLLEGDEKIIPDLNKRLRRQKLTVNLPSYADYERHYDFKKGTPPTLGGVKCVFRQFSEEDGRAGRIYGHWVQRMPSRLRPYLRIDGQPTVELDYGSMQLVLLYGTRGLPIPDDCDLYQLPGMGCSRSDMKMVLTKSVGNPTRDATLGPIREELHKQNRSKIGKAEELYDAFWQAHSSVCPHYPVNTEAAWANLQNLDSRIALRVLAKLLDQGITAIPIHDSFVVQSRYEDQTRKAMKDAFAEMFPNTVISVK